MIRVKKPSVAPSVTSLLSAALLVGASGMAFATPVMFTTNEVVNGEVVATNGPYRVSYITVYVDGVRKCYTESNGNCTGAPLNLTPGLHTATYVWATCNNPASCPHYGEVTHYVNVPEQTDRFDVRIPTIRTRWYGAYGDNVSLNGLSRGVALGGGTLSTNVMSGCYTASYKNGYSTYIPPWPTLPGVPDASLFGFKRVCFGSSDTYPTPAPDSSTDTNPPHVRITIEP
jgi:hypothetical protein